MTPVLELKESNLTGKNSTDLPESNMLRANSNQELDLDKILGDSDQINLK